MCNCISDHGIEVSTFQQPHPSVISYHVSTSLFTHCPDFWYYRISLIAFESYTWNPVFVLVIQSCLTLCNLINFQPVRLLCPWNFPGKNTEVGCYFLLQDMESYRLFLSHHCHMIFFSSSKFLLLCEVCKFPQLIVWIQQLRSILSNAAGWRWSLTPSGIKRLLSFSSFSQDIPFAGPTPTPITQP